MIVVLYAGGWCRQLLLSGFDRGRVCEVEKVEKRAQQKLEMSVQYADESHCLSLLSIALE
jgi:hypothetical protein